MRSTSPVPNDRPDRPNLSYEQLQSLLEDYRRSHPEAARDGVRATFDTRATVIQQPPDTILDPPNPSPSNEIEEDMAAQLPYDSPNFPSIQSLITEVAGYAFAFGILIWVVSRTKNPLILNYLSLAVGLGLLASCVVLYVKQKRRIISIIRQSAMYGPSSKEEATRQFLLFWMVASEFLTTAQVAIAYIFAHSLVGAIIK